MLAVGVVSGGLVTSGILATAPAIAGLSGTAGSPGWPAEKIPGALSPGDQLTAVSCPTAQICFAVGQTVDHAGASQPLIERWADDRWTAQAAPGVGGWSAVSCPSASYCVAAGEAAEYGSFAAAQWDGTSWAALPAPPLPPGYSSLNGLSCPEAGWCMAVGTAGPATDSHAFSETWNGSSWTSATGMPAVAGGTSQMSSASCTAESFCAAVGSSSVEHNGTYLVADTWDGTGWTGQTIGSQSDPTGGAFDAVSCTSASWCMAVGTGELQLWQGSAWNAAPAPTIEVDRLSCTSERACTAVGGNGAERWTGDQWVGQTVPSPGALVFQGVSCSVRLDCMAVGARLEYPVGGFVTAARLWSRGRWSTPTTVGDALGGQPTSLTSVSCPAAQACTAVGSFTPMNLPVVLEPPNNTDLSGLAAERWDGTSWRGQHIRAPAGAEGSTLASVSCPTAKMCMAVGYYEPSNANDSFESLAELWNGRTWTIVHARNREWHNSYYDRLSGVSCVSPRNCTAVGDYILSRFGAPFQMLIEHWNGRDWTVEPAHPDGYLTAVSCPRAHSCFAVGTNEANSAGLVMHWKGRGRSRQASAGTNFYKAVSCTRSPVVRCSAIGNGVARWNGHRWRVQSSPDGQWWLGLSCAARLRCTAITNYYNGSVIVTLAARWTGHAWTIQNVPAADDGEPVAVSCRTGGGCTAVGTANYPEPLALHSGSTGAGAALTRMPVHSPQSRCGFRALEGHSRSRSGAGGG